MKEQIKELRIKIDGISQLVKELKPIELNLDDYIMSLSDYMEYPNLKINMRVTSKELIKSYDSLILAKAWLGKVLQELGEETPYKNDSNRKSVEDIEETADQSILHVKFDNKEYYIKYSDHIQKLWHEEGTSHIEKVDWLREEIKDMIDTTPDFCNDFSDTRIEEIVLEQGFAYKYLSEARFWLDFELGRIRDAEKN